MKPFKTLGGLALSVSALLLASSCTKSFDDKESRDVAQLDQHEAFIPCGLAIELQTKQNTATGNFFWIGAKSDLAARQNFNGTNFTDNKYFDIIAANGVPFHKQQNGAIGVKNDANPNDRDYAIDGGEQLWFTLSSNYAGYKMSGFDIILHGDNSTVGVIELYDGGEMVKSIPVTTTSNPSKNFGISFQTTVGENPAEFEFFDQIRFIGVSGRFHILGFQGNNNPALLKPGRFNLANTDLAVYMRNQESNNSGAILGYKNTYINKGFYPGSEVDFTDRQYKAQAPNFSETPGSGEYNVLNPDKWLKITSSGGMLFYKQSRLGVGTDDYIQSGESVTIEPGTSFPSTHFGAFEFREATIQNSTGDLLDWKAYDGMTMVASGTTTGIDQSYNFIQPGVKFNKVVISGKTANSQASIGRPSNQVMSAYPSCPE
jgi:hypothetical protein